MKRTTPALGAVLALFLATAMGFGQGVSPEARRYFEAGLAAVEAAGSPADYRAAVAELEQAARLAPDWPGVFRALGLVERAARRYGDAARSFRRYVELAPGAADASRFRSLADEMDRRQDLEADASRIIEMMASGRYSRKYIGKTDLAGELAWPGSLDNFRLDAGGLLVENPWYPGDRYHPEFHPRIPDRWEPVKVDGRFYEYGYSHYMDTTAGYVVRFDYGVQGEVVSFDPPRLKETVDWAIAWGAPVRRNVEPWTGDLEEQGAVEYLYELAPRAGGAAAAPLEKPADTAALLRSRTAEAGGPDVEGLLALGRESMAKADNGGTLLHWAAANGHTALAERLISEGADVGARDKNGDTPLHWAAGWNKTAVAAILIAHGARPEAKRNDGATPLHDASRAGSLETADLLIAKGADPRTKAADGSTPLHYAAANGWPALADILVAKGADIGAVDANGDTPLHWASGWGKTEAARLLIARGARVDARRNDGATPLHDAARTGSLDVAGLLIAAGAGVDAEDAGGRTPLALALANDKKDVVELLKKNGARR